MTEKNFEIPAISICKPGKFSRKWSSKKYVILNLSSLVFLIQKLKDQKFQK